MRRDAARLNELEIKEVVHCLHTHVAASGAVRIFSFRKFSTVFPQVFIDIWISHVLNMVVYHRTLHKYINWKPKCKDTGSL